jgi:sterol desaturase/sphingolipid hydroxylase (fatty acid hydroxylase superfamily)
VEFIRTFPTNYVGYVGQLAWVWVFFLALETLFPRGKLRVSLRTRLKSLAFWLVYIPCIMVTTQLFMSVWAPLGLRPLLPSLAPPGLPTPVGAIVGGVAAAFIGDFFYYWCHRAQHRWLWRFHAVHHSVREMSGVTAYHHFSEGLIKLVLYSVPLSLLTTDPFAIPVLGWLVALQGYYVHSQTRLTFGPLGRYVVDNHFHRIHHSMEPRHFDKNFGVITTLWDSLFGTAYFPAKDEWPDTGLADFPEPAGVGEYLLAPFTYRRELPSPLAGGGGAQDSIRGAG